MAADPHEVGQGLGGRVPLGELLVRRGVLSEEQLAFALAEQQRSGEKLGAVLVRLGYTIGPTVGLGLATQHGGPLKTEYGYAAAGNAERRGDSTLPPPVAAPPVAVPPAPRSQPKPAPAPAASRQQRQLEQLEADMASTEAALDASRLRCVELQRRVGELQAAAGGTENADAAARIAQLEAELAQARARTIQLDQAYEQLEAGAAQRGRELAQARARIARLEAELAQTAAGVAQLDEASAGTPSPAGATQLEAELAQARTRVAQLEQVREQLEAGTAQHGRELEQARTRTVQLEAELAGAAARVAQLEAEGSNAPAPGQVTQLEAELAQAGARILQLEAAKIEAERTGPAGVHDPRAPLFRFEEHAADRSHLLFAPVANGYLLFEQQGPPPVPETLLSFVDANGVTSRFRVAEVGAPPLPGITLACAFLVEAE